MTKTPNKNFYDIYHADRCGPLINAISVGQLEMNGLSRVDYPGLALPDGVLTGVYSIGYWDAKINQNWGLNWHRNEGIEFTFLSSGNLNFSTKAGNFDLKPGDFTITRPWQLHKVGDPNVAVGRLYWMILDVGVRQPHQKWKWPEWIILSKKDLEYLTKVLRQNEMPVWKGKGQLHECFRRIGKCLDESTTEIPQSKLNLLINELLLQLLDLFKQDNVALDESLTVNLRTVEIFLNHLKSDFERQWTLDEMAKHCGLGISSLTKYCKQLTNLTPINFLTKIRLEVAKKKLANDAEKSVTDIGYECGFSSSQYFATVFKRQYKFSPRKYRAKFGFFEVVPSDSTSFGSDFV